jgi:hypothetical protein
MKALAQRRVPAARFDGRLGAHNPIIVTNFQRPDVVFHFVLGLLREPARHLPTRNRHTQACPEANPD